MMRRHVSVSHQPAACYMLVNLTLAAAAHHSSDGPLAATGTAEGPPDGHLMICVCPTYQVRGRYGKGRRSALQCCCAHGTRCILYCHAPKLVLLRMQTLQLKVNSHVQACFVLACLQAPSATGR